MLSICITNKNRSKVEYEKLNYFPFVACIDSIVKSIKPEDNVDLIVTDWESTDMPTHLWLPIKVSSFMAYKVVMIQNGGYFSRGKGLNIAAQFAKQDILLFMDTDILVDRNFLLTGINAVQGGKAFFPICFGYSDMDKKQGQWRDSGKGIVMLSRAIYEAAGKWDEFETWGFEDVKFFERVSKLVPVERREIKGFYHLWHPSDLAWKNRYAKEAV